jgi:hypothetical protein
VPTATPKLFSDFTEHSALLWPAAKESRGEHMERATFPWYREGGTGQVFLLLATEEIALVVLCCLVLLVAGCVLLGSHVFSALRALRFLSSESYFPTLLPVGVAGPETVPA